MAPTEAIDWNAVDLVVFDVDGTLYDQRRLRSAMLWRLLASSVRARSLQTPRVLRIFRHVREELGDRAEPDADFATLQYSLTAQQCGMAPAAVQALVSQWMEQRPLPLLRACRYPHVDRLFAGLRAAGKKVAVLSDYPAAAKILALGLHADPVVSASDAGVLRLKPDPTGLQSILRVAGTAPSRAVMIGDRFDRDGEVARRAGVRALIRSSRRHPQHLTFEAYDDPVFEQVLASEKGSATGSTIKSTPGSARAGE